MDKEIKVLVADDEGDFRQLMTFWLQSKGYSVLTAADGNEAVGVVREQRPDIVFLDLNMPVMDGPEALKKIREINKDLPVIVISAYIESPIMREIEPFGISGVFYKGGDFKDGLSLLEAALRTHKKLKR